MGKSTISMAHLKNSYVNVYQRVLSFIELFIETNRSTSMKLIELEFSNYLWWIYRNVLQLMWHIVRIYYYYYHHQPAIVVILQSMIIYGGWGFEKQTCGFEIEYSFL